MPAIDIQVLEGVFDADEKAEIIRKVSEGFGAAAGRAMMENTSVRIHEVQSGAWGYAGEVLTTEMARAIKARG